MLDATGGRIIEARQAGFPLAPAPSAVIGAAPNHDAFGLACRAADVPCPTRILNKAGLRLV